MLRHLRIVAAGVAALLLGAAPALAQDDHSPEALFKAFGGGLWENTHPISVEKMETIPQPLTPEYQAKKDEQTRNRAEGREILTTDNRCIPSGMPRMMMQAGFEFIPHAKSLDLVTTNMQVRTIWLDGRKHTPADQLFDTFSGESVGHWEGDTLVVTTIGLRPTNEVLYGVPGHSMSVDERIRKTGPDTLEIVTTVKDPVVFTQPWVYTNRFKRNPDKTLSDINYCVHVFDREVNDKGVEGFDLTPPPDPRKSK